MDLCPLGQFLSTLLSFVRESAEKWIVEIVRKSQARASLLPKAVVSIMAELTH